jgi:hypothetical protein
VIAFPNLVTGGIEKTEQLDPDKVLQQMQMQPRESFSDTPPAVPAVPGATPGSDPLTPPQEEKEDPMKGLLESIQKERAKKP